MATLFIRSTVSLAPSAATLAKRERAARAERRAAGRIRADLSTSIRPDALDAPTIGAAIDSWMPRLASLARRWGSANDSQDIVQSVALRLLSGASASYDPARGTLFAFLSTCIVREAIDSRRSWKRRNAASFDDASAIGERIGDMIPDSSGLDPASAAVEVEILRIIDQRLSEIASATLRAWLETGSTAAIANRFGIPEGTAKRRLFDARAALAKILG